MPVQPPRISVIVPCYNAPKEQLRELLTSLANQSMPDFELLLVDDCSTKKHYGILQDPRFVLIQLETNGGPAKARNAGAHKARAPYLFFTDSDCALHANTLKHALRELEQAPLVTGNTITQTRTFFGKAVACLGYPGGGCLGFDRVWRVDKQSYTTTFSSCNIAMPKELFMQLGEFDTTFPVPCGEDTLLAMRAVETGHKIKYAPQQIVFHVERPDWAGFVRWQITRGRGAYHFKKKVGSFKRYVGLRIWSYTNSLKCAGFLHGPLVIFLILATVYYHKKGYAQERKRQEASA